MVGAPVLGPDGSRPGPAAGGSEFILRVASALVLAPLALVTASSRRLAVRGVLGVRRDRRSVGVDRAGRRAQPMAGVCSGAAALAGAVVFATFARPWPALALVATGGALAALLAPAGRRAWSAAGVVYAGALVSLVLLRADVQYGFLAVVFLFAVVWVTDILAYFVGRAIGGPKLWPRVSPKKTWSGAVGGAVAAMVAGSATAAIAGLTHVPAVAVLALGLSVVSQAGDFAESAIKRRFGAKDASHLIPGHGGLMDRLDGFLAAVLIAAIVGVMRGGADASARGLLVW